MNFLCSYIFVAYVSLFLILKLVPRKEGEEKGDYDTLGFCLTLIPSFIMGTGYAFGESTILGYLRLFPKELVGGWSSGTGLSGLTGACLNLLVKLTKTDLQYLYIGVSPACYLYLICFYLTDMLYKRYKVEYGEINVNAISNASIEKPEEEGLTNTDGETENNLLGDNKASENEAPKNREMSFANLGQAFVAGGRIIINLGLVYLIEFTTLNGIAERVTHESTLAPEGIRRAPYEFFCLCYQIGCFISRSALVIVKRITIVEMFTILQLTNCVFWIFEKIFFQHLITNFFGLVPLLIILGFFGGGSYAACFYFILNSTTIPSDLKELCINVATICNDLGTLGSSFLTIFIQTYIFPIKD